MITSTLSEYGIRSSPFRAPGYYQMNIWDLTPEIPTHIFVFCYPKNGYMLRGAPKDMYDHPVTLLLMQIVDGIIND